MIKKRRHKQVTEKTAPVVEELAVTFGIQSIPTFLFIPVKGKPTAQMGAMQKKDFEEIIKQVIFK